MVDAVMSFEGDAAHHFRILRAVKNRFGATDEIGVFEMGSQGLQEVPNPSALFSRCPGCQRFRHGGLCRHGGHAAMLVEIQALVTPTALGTPRRAVVAGTRTASPWCWPCSKPGRRAAGQHDVYMNVAGGFRITEPAADLAVAAALVSSLADVPIPPQTTLFGEVSLSGLVRPVPLAPSRLKEAAKLGFSEALVPEGAADAARQSGLKARPVQRISDLVAEIAGGVPRSRSRAVPGRAASPEDAEW